MERQTTNTRVSKYLINLEYKLIRIHRKMKKNKNRIMTVKSSIKSSGWKPQFLQTLYDLVDDINVVVTHTYAFSKYIFLQELEHNEKFDLGKHVPKDFFRKDFFISHRQRKKKLYAFSQHSFIERSDR